MKEIPILEYKGNLIVSIQFELTDSVALRLQETILGKIERSAAKGLVIDVSSLDMVDSFIARVFMETAHMALLMNVKTVLAGIRPEVALTLVQMGFSLSGVLTAPDLESGIEALDAARLESEAGIS